MQAQNRQPQGMGGLPEAQLFFTPESEIYIGSEQSENLGQQNKSDVWRKVQQSIGQ